MKKFLPIAFLLLSVFSLLAQPYCEPHSSWCSVLSKPISQSGGTVFTNYFIETQSGVGTNTTIDTLTITSHGGLTAELSMKGPDGDAGSMIGFYDHTGDLRFSIFYSAGSGDSLFFLNSEGEQIFSAEGDRDVLFNDDVLVGGGLHILGNVLGDAGAAFNAVGDYDVHPFVSIGKNGGAWSIGASSGTTMLKWTDGPGTGDKVEWFAKDLVSKFLSFDIQGNMGVSGIHVLPGTVPGNNQLGSVALPWSRYYGGVISPTGITNETLTATTLLRADANKGEVSLANGTANQVVGMNSGATGQEYKTISGAGQNTITHAANSITVGSTVTNLAVRKTADQTLDSTTVTDDTDLQFSLAAGEKAEFFLQAKFVAGSTAADGLKITMTNTATAATGQYGLWHHRISIAAGTLALNASQVTFGTTGTGSTIDADTYAEIAGFIQQGTVSGTIKFQWAKNADAGTGHTCKSNSVVRVIKF